MFAPIALFTFNRKDHLKKTIEALKVSPLSKESELYIFSDGPKNEIDAEKVGEVRDYLKTISGFKSVHITLAPQNKGLAESIIAGVTELVNRFGKVIVLEDDLVSSPYFLEFMNQALDLYENEDKVACIHGYIYPIKPPKTLPDTFFLQHASSWGWATWKRAWDLFEKDGQKLMNELKQKNLIHKFNINGAYNFSGMLQRQIDGITNSWAIRWSASCLVNDKLNLYPNKSLIQNIGQDGSGTNMKNNNLYQVELSPNQIPLQKIVLIENQDAVYALQKFWNDAKPTPIERIVRKISRLIK